MPRPKTDARGALGMTRRFTEVGSRTNAMGCADVLAHPLVLPQHQRVTTTKESGVQGISLSALSIDGRWELQREIA